MLFISILTINTLAIHVVDIEITAIEEDIITERDIMKQLYLDKMDLTHKYAEYARARGFDENSNLILSLKEDWWTYHSIYQYYANEYIEPEPEVKWISDEKFEEYPVASEIWIFLKEQGYNDFVCAGIIGNMMAECGGNTLALQPMIYSPGQYFYGLCQWNRTYYSEVFNLEVQEQLNFLMSNIEYELNTFGYAFKDNFKYKEFTELENEQDVALAFAKCYERCDKAYYSVRQVNATTAYNYFVGE